MKHKRDPFTHCTKCHLHKSQWYGVCDHEDCKHETMPVPRINKDEFLKKAAWAFKGEILKAQQSILGKDIMDEVAMKLNAEPSLNEFVIVETLWKIFESLGALYSEQPDKIKMEQIIENLSD